MIYQYYDIITISIPITILAYRNSHDNTATTVNTTSTNHCLLRNVVDTSQKPHVYSIDHLYPVH